MLDMRLWAPSAPSWQSSIEVPDVFHISGGIKLETASIAVQTDVEIGKHVLIDSELFFVESVTKLAEGRLATACGEVDAKLPQDLEEQGASNDEAESLDLSTSDTISDGSMSSGATHFEECLMKYRELLGELLAEFGSLVEIVKRDGDFTIYRLYSKVLGGTSA